MKTKNLTLDDLTKAELIDLIQRCYPRLEETDFLQVRQRSMYARAKQIAEEAVQEMEAHMGGDLSDLQAFIAASKKTDVARKLYDQAYNLWDVIYGIIPEKGSE